MATRPNIVYVLTDEQRADLLGCAGNPVVRTPNLDRLAGEGVRFANAWCQSPICQPARASIVTGRYPHEHGVTVNFWGDLVPEWPTFMKSLRRAGYTTANVGKTHYYHPDFPALLRQHAGDEIDLRPMGEVVYDFGFDHVLEEFDRYIHALPVKTHYTEFLRDAGLLGVYRDGIHEIMYGSDNMWVGKTSPLPQEADLTSFIGRGAVDWIDGFAGDTPFFLQLSFVAPHSPLMADPAWAEQYATAEIARGPSAPAAPEHPIWSEHLAECRHHSTPHRLSDEFVMNAARQYYAMMSLVDEQIGTVLDALERKGVLDDTLIVHAADHGEMLGDHGLMAKMNFHRGAVEVPAIVRPPGGCDARVVEDLVEAIDITATIVDAARADAPEGSRGRSLLPATRGEPVGREVIFSEIRTQDMQNILNPPTGRPLFVSARDDRYRVTVEERSRTVVEMFDLRADPAELHTRIDDSSTARAQARLVDAIDAHLAGG